MAHDDVDPETNSTSGAIVDAAFYVHQRLGPGLYEEAYQAALAHRLSQTGRSVVRERAIDVVFDDLVLPAAYYADLIVDERVIVEVKAVDFLHRNHFAQLQTYLRFSGLRVGLLVNFDVPAMKLGIKRIVL